MVSPISRLKSGFTLLEVMVAVALFMLVMLLLVRGVTAVTTTVSLGQRQSQLHRILKSVRRVMQEDLESMIVHPDWPVFVGDGSTADPQLILAFLRYRAGSEGVTETEWVKYRRMEHDTEAVRLDKWVRSSAPFIDRSTIRGVGWWDVLSPASVSEEVLVDDLIDIEVTVQTSGGVETGTVTNQVDMVDIRLFLTVPPYAQVETPAAELLKRMENEEGSWMHFRTRPGFEAGPVVEVP